MTTAPLYTPKSGIFLPVAAKTHSEPSPPHPHPTFCRTAPPWIFLSPTIFAGLAQAPYQKGEPNTPFFEEGGPRAIKSSSKLN